MDVTIQKKNISDLMNFTIQEIKNPDKFVVMTTVIDDTNDKSLKRVITEFKSEGVVGILNPSGVMEAFPKNFSTFPDVDYVKWGLSREEYLMMIPHPFLILVFDKDASFSNKKNGNEQYAFLLTKDHNGMDLDEISWLKRYVLELDNFSERIAPMISSEDLQMKKGSCLLTYNFEHYPNFD